MKNYNNTINSFFEKAILIPFYFLMSACSIIYAIFIIWWIISSNSVNNFILNTVYQDYQESPTITEITFNKVIGSQNFNELSFDLPKNDKVSKAIVDPDEANIILSNNRLLIMPLLKAGETIKVNVKTLQNKNVSLHLQVSHETGKTITFQYNNFMPLYPTKVEELPQEISTNIFIYSLAYAALAVFIIFTLPMDETINESEMKFFDKLKYFSLTSFVLSALIFVIGLPLKWFILSLSIFL